MNALPFEQFKNSLRKKKEKKRETERPSLNDKYTIKDELHVQLVCIARYRHQQHLMCNISQAEETEFHTRNMFQVRIL